MTDSGITITYEAYRNEVVLNQGTLRLEETKNHAGQ